MAAPSYLRQIATRQATEPGHAMLAPRRILFRPIPSLASRPLEMEAEPTPPRLALASRIPQAAATPMAVSSPIDAELHMPAAPRERELRHPESSVPEGPRTLLSATPNAADQGTLDGPARRQAPTVNRPFAPSLVEHAGSGSNARDRTSAAPAAHRAELAHPEPVRDATGIFHLAIDTKPGNPNAGRDRRPVFAAEGPASQAPPRVDQRLRGTEMPRAAAELITAKEDRILLTPPPNRGLREPGASTKPREAASGGVHIGSLEVHVTAPPVTVPPVTAVSLPPSFPPSPVTRSGRASAPLARGFPGFGLVQS